MRFDDLIKKPAKPHQPLTYQESLQAKLDAHMIVKPIPKFKTLKYSTTEGRQSLEKK